MRTLLVFLWPCFLLFQLCVSQFGESTGTFWKSSHNRTKAFFRRTRDTSLPAPIDCKLKTWTPWTPCDSCTEKTVRFRYVERHSQFGGTDCVHSQWDEKFCPLEGECNPQDECGEMFACPETGRCIGQHLRCNGDWDCGFGNDEEECDESRIRETKCSGMLPIPGAQKAMNGYNALAQDFVNPVLDPKYFGGICEYIYNGEWRMLTYDAFCENLYYSDDEKYFRMPYNFLSYRLMAHSISEGSTEHYSDASSLQNAVRTESSSNFGLSIGVQYVEAGFSGSDEFKFLQNITQHDSKEVEFLRLVSRVETAEFKMRTQDLMLHEDMLLLLMELPEHYDFGAYSRLIREYGTHYVTRGVMGGILDYVLVLNKEAMKRQKVNSYEVGSCIGVSLGLTESIDTDISVKLKAKYQTCEKVGDLNRDFSGSSSIISAVIGYIKGGTTGPSAGQLAVRNAVTYRKWGKSLKYSPAVLEYETLPIYELVRSSTAAAQASSRLPHLKQAWEEYMQQFNPCRCAPCRNNGVPVIMSTACSCLCAAGQAGIACEKTQRQGPTHGAWSCWSSWSPCVSGTKTRRRECNNPAPKDNGFPCQGTSEQRKSC